MAQLCGVEYRPTGVHQNMQAAADAAGRAVAIVHCEIADFYRRKMEICPGPATDCVPGKYQVRVDGAFGNNDSLAPEHETLTCIIADLSEGFTQAPVVAERAMADLSSGTVADQAGKCR